MYLKCEIREREDEGQRKVRERWKDRVGTQEREREGWRKREIDIDSDRDK